MVENKNLNADDKVNDQFKKNDTDNNLVDKKEQVENKVVTVK